MIQKVQLYKIRDFGSKINATIDYIRQNILSLVKVVLLIVAPMGLLMGIIFSGFFSSFAQMAANPEMNNANGMEMMANMGMNYMLMMLLSTVTFAFLISSIFGYMKLNDAREVQPSPMEVYSAILKKIPMLVILMVLIGIVSAIGFVFFFLPGVYLMITLSLAIPIYLFEDEGIGTAFSKSFKLIKGKWWSTFGLLFVTGIIASVISYVFAIPLYAIFLGDLFTSLPEAGNDPSAVFSMFSSWYSVVGFTIMMIGTYITYLIPVIALGFQYFNLSERVEGRGIRNQIDEFETVS